MTQILRDLRPLRHFGRHHLLVPAFRYYLGRMTAATICFAHALAEAWSELDENEQHTIKRELERAFKRDDEMRSDPVCSTSYYPLGGDSDRVAWELVRARYSGSSKKCRWTYHAEHDEWTSGCGATFDSSEFGCDEIKICPGCGEETEVVP